MVVKKNNIQKQKGGELRIPERVREYFYIALELLKRYSNLLKLYNSQIKNITSQSKFQILSQLEVLKKELSSYDNAQNHLLKNLCVKLLILLNKDININEFMIEQIKISIYIILQTLFSDIYVDTSIKFPMKLIKIYIHILFIQYLNSYNKTIFKNILNTFNKTNNKKNVIIERLKRHNRSLNSQTEIDNLIREIRRMFLEEYPTIYGVPVFYGNINDDLNAETRKYIGYNQFICEKVGVSSSEKRKYTINPVGAIALMYINNKYNIINTPLYELLGKILRFNYKRGINKGENIYFYGLPKLKYLSNGTIFCIARNERNIESVITGDLSRCSKIFGCSLKMTAEIREEENIASEEHILELLDILLNMYLENEDMFPRNIKNNRPRQDFSQIRQGAAAQQLSVSRGQGAAAAAAPPLMRRAISRNIKNN